jgi:Zn-dependent M28 family amino/carboxypeptidase
LAEFGGVGGDDEVAHHRQLAAAAKREARNRRNDRFAAGRDPLPALGDEVAAGVGIVTAAAKLIADLPQRPRRTIRVVLFGAEETGIHGAIAYAARHKSTLDKHIVAAESDFGARKVFRYQTRFADAALPFARATLRLLAPLGINPHDNRANGGPDVGPLREAGVPVVNLAQNGWDYFNYHHTPDDTLDKIDEAELRQNVAAYVVFAYLSAEMDWDYRTGP